MPEYIYLTHPLRDGFFEQPTPEEDIIMEEHFQYLKQATEAGTVLLAGPCLDDTFGIVIFLLRMTKPHMPSCLMIHPSGKM